MRPAGEKTAITLGITCYREGAWLRECWESVLAQTDDRWEAVLVMDGGADEATRAVFDGIEHSRVRKFAFDENRGPYPVRNKAFEMTRTPYHFYLDGDDQLVPESVQMVLAAAEENPGASLIYGDYEYFGAVQESRRYGRFPVEVTKDELARWHCIPGTSVYSRAIWEELRGFADELSRGSADYDFHIGAIQGGAAAVHVGEVFYRYRINAGSVSLKNMVRKHETREIMVRRHPEFFADDGRRRVFLDTGYDCSFEKLYGAGRLPEAKAVAARALANGYAGPLRRRMEWLARLPLPLYQVVRRVTRPLRKGFRLCSGGTE